MHRHGGEFAHRLHGGAAFFAHPPGIMLVGRIGRNVRFRQRHGGHPCFCESVGQIVMPRVRHCDRRMILGRRGSVNQNVFKRRPLPPGGCSRPGHIKKNMLNQASRGPFRSSGNGKALFVLFTEQLAARPMDEMKSATGRAQHRFVSAMRIARCGLVREPMLHVHAGAGTFEDEVIHAVGQLDDCAVGRLDLCQFRKAAQGGSLRGPNKTLK